MTYETDLLEDLRQRRSERLVSLPPPANRRSLRREARLTQQDFAELLHVERGSIARYEAGAREPRGETRRRYAEILRWLAGEVRDAG